MAASSLRKAILLVNLGTPDKPEPLAIKRYLAQFLQDRRVVDLSPFIWQPLLHGIILPKRAAHVAALYRSIWQEKGSPLLIHSVQQKNALSRRLPNVTVCLAMTYGQPSIMNILAELGNIGELIILPLFPQYSSSTTASVWDAVNRYYAHCRFIPSITFIRDYATHPLYIHALTQSILRSFQQNGQPDLLLFSYHGIPKRYIEKGDDYENRCQKTTSLVMEQLGYCVDYQLSYQSRFGKEHWLQPYTNEIIMSLVKQGIKNIHVICPGFAADCLETLEEIAIRTKKIFLQAGGSIFHYIPALNHSDEHIDLLTALVSAKL